MAFSGMMATPGYVGGDNAGEGKGPIFFPVGTSINMTTGTKYTLSFPSVSYDGLQPAVRLYASAESIVSVGPNANSASDTADNPRFVVAATTPEHIYLKPSGTTIMWQAA